MGPRRKSPVQALKSHPNNCNQSPLSMLATPAPDATLHSHEPLIIQNNRRQHASDRRAARARGADQGQPAAAASGGAHSPADGLVQQLAIYSEGAVLKAADPILVVMPDSGDLIVEAQVLNRDTGFVDVDQR